MSVVNPVSFKHSFFGNHIENMEKLNTKIMKTLGKMCKNKTLCFNTCKVTVECLEYFYTKEPSQIITQPSIIVLDNKKEVELLNEKINKLIEEKNNLFLENTKLKK